MTEKLVSVKADTADDFVTAATAKIGRGRLGSTSSTFAGPKWSADKSKKLVKVKFPPMKSVITRATWGGAVDKKPDKDNAAAIKKIEALNKAHEERHASRAEALYKKLTAKFEKDLIGKDPDEVDKAVETINDALVDDCEDLHKTEGKVEVKTTGGKPTVVESAEGPGGCK